ncbi:MAG: hypothetical protein OEZ58_01380 [Gammaproteobacteria bacterium]|nr:hypothetical protein [Gammaproteobacteria bacterium]
MASRLIILCSILFTSSCFAGESASQNVRINGFELAISQSQTACTLSYVDKKQKGSFDLEMTAPCFFLHEKNGTAQFKTITEFANVTVLIIAGTQVTPDQGKFPRPQSLRKDCAHQARAVLIRDDRITLSSRVSHEIIYCPESRAETKEFWLFAEAAQ